jgi:hypothetical protein
MDYKKDRLEELARVRADIDVLVDRLILVLDEVDSEMEDLEDTDDDVDVMDEPALGATEDIDQRIAWETSPQHTPDLELDYSPVERAKRDE